MLSSTKMLFKKQNLGIFTFGFTLVLLISSCATFSNKILKNSNKSTENNINKFEGTYINSPHIYYGSKGNPESTTKRNLRTLHKSLFNKEFKLDSNVRYFIDVKPLNAVQISFSLRKENVLIDSITIGGKLRDGMFYLDNKMFRCHGLPYLLGGCERRKIRIAINFKNELIVHETYDNSGAFLLFFWAGTSYNNAYAYARIND